ncbi:MAG: hypothetical protein ACFFG0_07120 [Candidatus Thorarchaeota archaeon]
MAASGSIDQSGEEPQINIIVDYGLRLIQEIRDINNRIDEMDRNAIHDITKHLDQVLNHVLEQIAIYWNTKTVIK